MASLPVWHCDAMPVLSNSGVEYPWQVQPLTATGAPPPGPATCPSLTLAAYSFSTRIATPQFTVPLATLIRTGTFTAVRVLPQVVPAVAAEEWPAPDEPPAPPPSRPPARPAPSGRAPAGAWASREPPPAVPRL